MDCRSSRVPGVAVYLLKLSRMARMAASLTLSGVGKSGSPAPKSTRSAPSARSFSASIMTAMVEETEILETRCENDNSPVRGASCNFFIRLYHLRPKPLLHRRRHQTPHVSAQLADLPQQAR